VSLERRLEKITLAHLPRHYLLSLGLVELLLKLLDLLLDELLSLLEEVVDHLLLVVIETEPDEAEEDSNIDHGADAHVASEVDEEEEAEDHAKREGDGPHKDSIDADTEEGLDNGRNKLEETVDLLSRDGDVLVSKLRRSLLTLEVLDNTETVEDEASEESEEGNPADEAKDGEVVAEEDNEEDIDDAEDQKGGHEIVPHEDLLSLAEELALLEGLADHVAGALARAGGGLGGLLLGSFFLLRGLLNRCRLLNRCGFVNLLFRHLCCQ